MTPELISQIAKAYPRGTIYERDDAVLANEKRDARINAVLKHCGQECDLSWDVSLFDTPAYKIAITQRAHPEFKRWIWQMGNSDKIAWINHNGGPYPVFWLNISRIADYYYYYYNHWTPRGDTGYLEADFRQPANAEWLNYEMLIRDQLTKAGFQYFTDDLCTERTPFVVESDYDSIPDDDPCWKDVGFEPPLVPSTLHECLFGH